MGDPKPVTNEDLDKRLQNIEAMLSSLPKTEPIPENKELKKENFSNWEEPVKLEPIPDETQTLGQVETEITAHGKR